ncbi:polysaccharide biosynthesis protein GtrA [[Bacillus] sp. KCTC 13219]|nr:polysaccharide biosynthesis protein GtrA [[Bacillus] sp. KCTC 13219]
MSILKIKDNEIFRYLIVGVINTLTGTSVMFIAYNFLNYSYWMSSFLNYFIGSILSYYLNKKYTFKAKNTNKQTILLFALNIGVCYLLAYGVAKKIIYSVFESLTSVIADNISMVVGMGLFILFNYCGQKFIVFNNKN